MRLRVSILFLLIILVTGCRYTINQEPVSRRAIRRNNEIRLALFNAYRTGEGHVSARIFYGQGIEGGSATWRLTVNQGKVTLIIKSTANSWGPGRLETYKVSKLTICHRDANGVLKPLIEPPIPDEELTLLLDDGKLSGVRKF